MHFLVIITPHMRDKWTPRIYRELKVSITLLDLIINNQVGKLCGIKLFHHNPSYPPWNFLYKIENVGARKMMYFNPPDLIRPRLTLIIL